MTGIDVSTNGIDTIFFGGPDGEWLRTQKAAHRPETPEAADLALRADYADVIRKAIRIEEEDFAAVEAARKAIEQDTLDTPENIQAAARNLLAFGI
ncbi:MAG TPA: hypothetical protein P5279_05670 [Anaerohalosphaeraceae bacterium]|jgi:hypothetical protein|nr:hypothetical protein [Anaerohalosphaeraceae bacterium]HRT49960.1 hypothetical protein [Anaerohalosphaeraceae bacterium]HRT85742.1 hypothetical protein [Anaerohalosphaeraceae bacterium]